MNDNRDRWLRDVEDRSEAVPPAAVPPVRGDWKTLLGKRLRVLDGAGGRTVMGEGECVAVCLVPSVTLRDEHGNLTHHSTSLPIEVSEWRPL